VTVLLNRGGTHVSLTASKAESVFTEPVTVIARIKEGVPGSGTPTGTITFKAGNLVLGTAPVISGEAAFGTQSLPAGLHHISATYSGDSMFDPHRFGDVIHHVSGRSTVAITASPNPSTAGQTVTLTILVSSASGVPAGAVELRENDSFLGTTQLQTGGAQISTPALAAGLHILEVRYLGGPNHLPSSSTFFQFANEAGLAASNTSLTVSTSSSTPITPVNQQHVLFQESVTLTAHVTSGSPASGTVVFYEGTTQLGSPVPLTQGQASLILPGLRVGAHRITAVYQGDGVQTGGSISNTASFSRSPRPR
jgi:Big-like domain-containing protein